MNLHPQHLPGCWAAVHWLMTKAWPQDSQLSFLCWVSFTQCCTNKTCQRLFQGGGMNADGINITAILLMQNKIFVWSLITATSLFLGCTWDSLRIPSKKLIHRQSLNYAIYGSRAVFRIKHCQQAYSKVLMRGTPRFGLHSTVYSVHGSGTSGKTAKSPGGIPFWTKYCQNDHELVR